MSLLASGLWEDPVSGVLDTGRWAECWEMFDRTGADCCLGNTISEERKTVFSWLFPAAFESGSGSVFYSWRWN